MTVEGSFSKSYQHQYKVIFSEGDDVKEEMTTWLEVPEKFFWDNENNAGMELVSKSEDGKLSKQASPAGYNNYVGNEKYGRWVNRSGGSFWEFYGQYAFMSSMFNLFSPIPHRGYYDYRDNYRYSRPYYGGTGSNRTYGTYGKNMKKSRPSFQSRMNSIKQKSSSFRDRVRNRVNRSSSRYNSKSSFRSRGGGFGK